MFLIGLAVGAGLLLLTVPVVLWQQHKWRAGCKAGAEKLFREMSEMYQGEHTYRLVSAADYPSMEVAGYRQVGAELTSRGFRHLGSYENVTVSRVHPDHRTFMDGYVRDDGLVDVSTFRLLDMQTVDVGSYLEDGRFLVTTNASADKLTPPPFVMKETFPKNTSVEFLLARHSERMAALSTSEPRARFISVQNFDDALDLSRRCTRLVSQFRQEIGLITEEEMVGLAERRDQEATARLIWREIQRLRKQQATGRAQ
jgi:hypothetical protein